MYCFVVIFVEYIKFFIYKNNTSFFSLMSASVIFMVVANIARHGDIASLETESSGNHKLAEN